MSTVPPRRGRDRSSALWQAAAVVALALVLAGVAFGRPDADHFRVREVSAPACAADPAQTGLPAAFGRATLIASASVQSVDDTHVTLAPDHYFYGAASWAPLTIRVDRDGWNAITWTPGARYLIVARDGELMECAQTQPWSAAADKALRARYG